MYSRKRVRSGEAIPGTREIAKTPQQNVTQGESKWGESVLEKWRGALVKARLALHKKREKKKERNVKSTLARLRKIADAAKQQGDDKASKQQGNASPPSKQSKHSAHRVAKARVSAVAPESTFTKIPKRARTLFLIPQSDVRSQHKEPEGKITSTRSDLAEDAKQRVEMLRKEEIRNRWKAALEFARSQLRQQKRELIVEQKTPVARSDGGEAQDGFSPSLDELEDFAKKVR